MFVLFAVAVMLVLAFLSGYLFGTWRSRIIAGLHATKNNVVVCRGRRAVFRRPPTC
jgi:hypothetical protein